jgi:hypothetical protein
MTYQLTTAGKRVIPVQLSEFQFNEFILKHLPEKIQKRHYRVPRFRIFNYILKFLHMGCQWKTLPIEKDSAGRPEIHYTQVFRFFQIVLHTGAVFKIFENSVLVLNDHDLLDTSATHGDSTTTMAKKGGDCLGFSGHRHMLSEKVLLAFVDRNCNVLSPMIVAPGNRHEGPLFVRAFGFLKDIFKKMNKSLKETIIDLFRN